MEFIPEREKQLHHPAGEKKKVHHPAGEKKKVHHPAARGVEEVPIRRGGV